MGLKKNQKKTKKNLGHATTIRGYTLLLDMWESAWCLVVPYFRSMGEKRRVMVGRLVLRTSGKGGVRVGNSGCFVFFHWRVVLCVCVCVWIVFYTIRAPLL